MLVYAQTAAGKPRQENSNRGSLLIWGKEGSGMGDFYRIIFPLTYIVYNDDFLNQMPKITQKRKKSVYLQNKNDRSRSKRTESVASSRTTMCHKRNDVHVDSCKDLVLTRCSIVSFHIRNLTCTGVDGCGRRKGRTEGRHTSQRGRHQRAGRI